MRSLLLALAASIGLAAPAFAAGPAQTPWPMFRGNAQHTSSTTVSGSLVNPRILWSKPMTTATDYGGGVDNPFPLYGPSIGPDGTLFVPVFEKIWAVNPNTGATIWTTAAGGAMSQPAVTDDGKVIYSSQNVVVAVSTDTGAPLWNVDPRKAVAGPCSTPIFGGGPVTISSAGLIYVGDQADERQLGTYGACLYKINPNTGAVMTQVTGVNSMGAPVISTDGTRIFAHTNFTQTYTFAAAGLTVDSTHNPGSLSDGMALSVSPDGFAYYSSETSAFGGERILKMDLSVLNSPTTAWTAATAGWTNAPPKFSPVVGPNTIITSASGGLQAFNRATGASAWSYAGSGNALYQGVPTLVNGTSLYFYDDALGRLSNLNPNTGADQWRLSYRNASSNDQKGAGGIAVSSTGVVYVLRSGGFGTRFLEAFGDSGARNIATSSSALTQYEGSVWVSTVVIRATTAGAANAPNATINVSFNSSSGLSLMSPTLGTALNSSYGDYEADANGLLALKLASDLSILPHSSWTAFSSTLTATVIGAGASTQALTMETRASTFTVTLSTPSIEDNGTSIVRVTTVTFTVSNSTGGRVTSFPVGLDALSYTSNLGGVCGTPSSVSPAGNFQLTNSTGQAQFVYRIRVAAGTGTSLNACVPYDAFQNLSLPLQAFALGLPPVTVDARDARPSTFTVSFSSPAIQSDVRHATMTVTVFDSVGSTVPGTVVALNNLNTLGFLLVSFNNYKNDGTGILCTGSSVMGYTDSLGSARFLLDNRPCNLSTFDNFSDYPSSQPVFTPNIAVATPTIAVESNFLSSYQVAVPTITSVGVAFRSTVTAVNAYGHLLPKYNEAGVTLTPLFDQTAVQGTGTLGTSVVSFAASGGQVVISSQTYNKIEDIQVKATRGSGVIKTGLSGTLIVRGPDHFIVTVPTAAQAGVPFAMTVRAVDASSQPVVGYAATISLSALNAGNPSLAGAGVLGVTNVNVPANGVVTIANQTYTKAESIVIRASDSGAGVVGVSTYAAVVGAGTPASIILLANPQSTIAGVPSALTATILDGFSNPVTNSTATFSVATGSGIVSLSLTNGAVVSAAVSTQAVTDAFGQATAFFSSTNSLSAQANLLRASLGGLTRDTTVYSAVLVSAAGGAVVNSGDPRLRAECPANTYGFAVRLSLQSKAELSAADLALTTAAFAATANTFVSTTVLKISAVRDASPGVAAGPGGKLMKVSMPYVVTSGSISVGSFGAQSILVPLSVMRIFRLNQVSSVFEQVLDGASGVDSAAGTVTAEVSDPDGIYALGAPAFTTLAAGSSATVTTALAGGTSAQVVVPLGGFASPATISVTVPGASAVPALPSRPGLTGLGITVSVTAGGLQPASPVTLKIGYRLVDVAGINPDHLRLARYDAATGWTVLDSGADTEARQVVGQTDHFSLFQIVAQAPSQSVADGFVFPNPFRPSLGHVNIKLSNLPAAAHVKIFTATGRLLKELDADASGQVLTWNGTDRDGRALASGVYLAVIEGAGGRRTIKFAVQR